MILKLFQQVFKLCVFSERMNGRMKDGLSECVWFVLFRWGSSTWLSYFRSLVLCYSWLDLFSGLNIGVVGEEQFLEGYLRFLSYWLDMQIFRFWEGIFWVGMEFRVLICFYCQLFKIRVGCSSCNLQFWLVGLGLRFIFGLLFFVVIVWLFGVGVGIRLGQFLVLLVGGEDGSGGFRS